MAGIYETTTGAGRGITALTVTATAAIGASVPTTMEDFTIGNDAGPVSAVPLVVDVSGTPDAILATAVTVAANAHACIITPPALNTVQLWLGTTNSTTGTSGVPAEGVKMSLLTPFIYTFDLGAVSEFYLKSTGATSAVDITVNLTWL